MLESSETTRIQSFPKDCPRPSTKWIGAGQHEGVSYECLWVHTAESKAILGEHAIVNFECGVAMRQDLIFEIYLTELWRSKINLCTTSPRSCDRPTRATEAIGYSSRYRPSVAV